MDQLSDCRIILIGMMGSGKTTIGRGLAAATGWEYVDNDELLLRRHGMTSRQILAAQGEARLRAAEREALIAGLELPPPVIVGVAAGTITDAGDRERLSAGGIVVWLRAAAATLVDRAMDAEHRPFVDTVGPDWLQQAAVDRAPLYTSVAGLVVDTDRGTPEEIVAAIREYLEDVDACP
ncbi:MAG TPA: shikimate kinase [Candidatus Binatia bacterium]|nr:shikimate kinase [Candidatus Binatia bacterium]